MYTFRLPWQQALAMGEGQTTRKCMFGPICMIQNNKIFGMTFFRFLLIYSLCRLAYNCYFEIFCQISYIKDDESVT